MRIAGSSSNTSGDGDICLLWLMGTGVMVSLCACKRSCSRVGGSSFVESIASTTLLKGFPSERIAPAAQMLLSWLVSFAVAIFADLNRLLFGLTADWPIGTKCWR